MKISSLRLGEGLTVLSQDNIKQYQNEEIDTIIIAANVQKISQRAFFQFTKVRKIIFEARSQCLEIEEEAFSRCVRLQKVFLPLSLREIAHRAFAFCFSLEETIFPNNLRIIDTEAFYYCISLKKCFINNEEITILKDAFTGCYKIKTVQLGNKIYYTRKIHDRLALYQKVHKFQDKLFCRALDNFQVQTGEISGDKTFFIWTRIGLFQGYGKNLHEALDEYNFEVGHRRVARELGELTPDSEINIAQYRALTKDCKAGTEEFLISKNIPLDATMKISDVYALSDGHGRSYLLEKIMRKGSQNNESKT